MQRSIQALKHIALFSLLLFGLHVWGHDINAPYAQWINSLMKPDFPSSSCCGLADQYYVKEYLPSQRKGIAFTAIVSAHDGSSNFNVDVPNEKVIWDRPNPTGQAIIFIQNNDATSTVVCFVPSLGL